MLPRCLLALTLLAVRPAEMLTLEIRVFKGSEEVTSQTRVTVHRAGQRAQPVASVGAGAAPAMRVPPGVYDAQAIQEQESRVVNIRWAERLVVMPYPDEEGHHLEVINFTPGYGALQIRRSPASGPADSIALYPAGDRSQPVATATLAGQPYVLFVVRAGHYDIGLKRGARTIWHEKIEIPVDRTRLWLVP